MAKPPNLALNDRLRQLSPEKRELLMRRVGEADASRPTQKSCSRQVEPLLPSQRRIWFLEQLAASAKAYNLPFAVQLSGKLHVPALKKSAVELVRRHQMLRTSIVSNDGVPMQQVVEEATLQPSFVDIQSMDLVAAQSELRRIMQMEAHKAFDLRRPPLMRVTVIRMAAEEHWCLLTVHHIAADGWSIAILVNELSQLYGAYSLERPSPLEPLPLQYMDFIHQQLRYLEDSEDHLSYWRDQFAQLPEPLRLPVRGTIEESAAHEVTRIPVHIPAELSEELRRFGRREDATPFMVLLAAYHLLLCACTGQEDVVVGVPIANRTYPFSERLVGMFVNLLPVRVFLGSPLVTFRNLPRVVRESMLSAYAHQELPFEKLLETLPLPRATSGQTLVQTILAMDDVPRLPPQHLAGLTMVPMALENSTTKFAWVLNLTQSGKGIDGWLEYDGKYFLESTISLATRRYVRILRDVVGSNDVTLDQLLWGASNSAGSAQKELSATFNF